MKTSIACVMLILVCVGFVLAGGISLGHDMQRANECQAQLLASVENDAAVPCGDA